MASYLAETANRWSIEIIAALSFQVISESGILNFCVLNCSRLPGVLALVIVLDLLLVLWLFYVLNCSRRRSRLILLRFRVLMGSWRPLFYQVVQSSVGFTCFYSGLVVVAVHTGHAIAFAFHGVSRPATCSVI